MGRREYLLDAGYMNRNRLIAPCRGVRYHLKEYSICSPENAKELFNLRHASLRNAIERAFGVLKKRFSIIEVLQSLLIVLTHKMKSFYHVIYLIII